MLIRNGKAFSRGLLLLISFLAVFIAFFMPIFPAQEERAEKTNGLVFADHLFNTLSKGSSNFFDPTLKAESSVDFVVNAAAKGKTVDIDVPLKDQSTLETVKAVVAAQGLTVSDTAGGLHIQGDLYALLQAAVVDSYSTYNNNLDEVTARHSGADGKVVMKAWWQLLSGMIKPMQRAGMVAEATAVNTLLTKGVECSYNFYGITPLRVLDNIPLVAGFLIFYVIYTMWYGFAIFELFEGIGLTMKKSVKQEV